MQSVKKISSALVSVYHKENLEPLLKLLHQQEIILYATGGTKDFIESLHLPVVAVEDITEYPGILGGRVKTLHPKVFGGILNRRSHSSDVAEVEKYKIPAIDLVIVDLYPFEETLKKVRPSGDGEEEVIEKIDVGGIALIRAAAKNFNDVLIIPSRDQYSFLHHVLENQHGTSSMEDRRYMATQAFNITSHYDTAIFNYFNSDKKITTFKQSILTSHALRYGENPHQKGTFYGRLEEVFGQLHGKEISYNNLLDADAAIALMNEFSDTTFAILKHNNACGIASREHVVDAWKAALAADPVSAFGGILITNRVVTKAVAEEINQLFFELIIAPSYDDDALQILKTKKNRILIIQKKTTIPQAQFRSLLNGVIEQDRDDQAGLILPKKTVTNTSPTSVQDADMEFANKIVKHTKSNAIVLVKDKQLLGSGAGQTSRVDALKQAIAKAGQFQLSLKGAVMASDAFFPFPDCVEIAHQAGIRAIIQPGGSLKDQDSIDYCNRHNLAMVMTGMRHFKH